ncbi:MAG: proprotein convertase P-domain-containing protein [Sandaracinaceae bacterium]
MPRTPTPRLAPVLAFALAGAGCGLLPGEDDEPPPPPPTGSGPQDGTPTTPVPAGQVMITVVANSTPEGATVVGGGRPLGTTPLTAQVPVPAPTPGEVQTFSFTFTLDGYAPTTIDASPVNDTISITAGLAPATGDEEEGEEDDDGSSGEDGRVLTVRGRGGGAIFDHNTTRGTATVEEACTIDRLQVRLRGNHSYYGDLHIRLRGPGGQTYSLARGGRANPFRTHTVRRAAGRPAQGTWRLLVEDRLDQDSGRLSAWAMSIACR